MPDSGSVVDKKIGIMVGKEFRDALRSGKTVYGTLITSASPKMFDIVITLGGRVVRCHSGSRGSLDIQMEWAKAGANIIMHSSDIFLFADKLQDDMNCIRELDKKAFLKGAR